MPITAFPKLKRVRPVSAAIADATLRDFSGGLKVTDNEIALKPKYASKLINMFADPDTSQVLRFGTKKFAVCLDEIVNFVYFRQHLVCVLVDGTIQKITDAGVVTTIWDDTIAGALPGSPDGWAPGVTLADFSEFRGELIVNNGTDKPVIIDKTLSVDYLQDLGTGSNVNTPIAKYVTTVANYLVMAGIENNETTIYISASGTSGTWPGDPDPNDAISFDVGAYTGQSSSDIFGIGSFKNFLVVFFDSFTVILQLGGYDENGVHKPEVIDTYQNIGTVNHKTFLSTETDLIFTANSGVFSAEKNVFGGTLETAGMSEDLGKLYPSTLGKVVKNEQKSFIVDDPLSKTLFYVFHKQDSTVQAFAMRYRDEFSKTSWAEIDGWSFTAAATSEKGRVFFAEGDTIYQYGNSVFSGEEYYADYIDEEDEENPHGEPIFFDWELPWLDAGNRNKTKHLKRVTFDTTGTSDFVLQFFVNNFYKKLDDSYNPAAEMEFVAGNAGGFGNNSEGFGGDGFGGGRRANDERFFGMPVRFRILKLRIHGSTRKPLRVVSISLIYARGNYNV